jgi:HAD superfamily hydrolase (TIGR01509 family)
METAAVVFDLDGVIVDSEHIWERARKALVEEHGLRYPPEATRAIMGMSAPEWAHYLRETLGVPMEEDAIDADIVARVSASYRAHLPLLPGAVECVRALSARYPLAVASSSNRVLIELVLDLAHVRDAFAVVVSSEEVARGKPSPDVYLRAADLLRLDPRACAAIEDSNNGIRSAKAAGMFVIALPNPHFPPSPETLALADARVDTLAEISGMVALRVRGD